MDEDKVSTEFRVRVYNDAYGYYAEAKPDSDGLGLCEIGYSDGDKDSEYKSFCVTWEMARHLADALARLSALNSSAQP